MSGKGILWNEVSWHDSPRGNKTFPASQNSSSLMFKRNFTLFMIHTITQLLFVFRKKKLEQFLWIPRSIFRNHHDFRWRLIWMVNNFPLLCAWVRGLNCICLSSLRIHSNLIESNASRNLIILTKQKYLNCFHFFSLLHNLKQINRNFLLCSLIALMSLKFFFFHFVNFLIKNWLNISCVKQVPPPPYPFDRYL